jgi:hypothetical protein
LHFGRSYHINNTSVFDLCVTLFKKTAALEDYFRNAYTLFNNFLFREVKMRGGKRTGAGRKKKPVHLKRNPVTIRLPQWMVLRLKREGEMGYLIEEQLAKKLGDLPEDYDINS